MIFDALSPGRDNVLKGIKHDNNHGKEHLTKKARKV